LLCQKIFVGKTRKSNIARKIRMSGKTSDKGGKFFLDLGLSKLPFFPYRKFGEKLAVLSQKEEKIFEKFMVEG